MAHRVSIKARVFQAGKPARIPKGFCPKAQGYVERATLGNVIGFISEDKRQISGSIAFTMW